MTNQPSLVGVFYRGVLVVGGWVCLGYCHFMGQIGLQIGLRGKGAAFHAVANTLMLIITAFPYFNLATLM